MLALNQCFGSGKVSGSAFDGRLDPDSDSEGLKRATVKRRKNTAKRQTIRHKSYKKQCNWYNK
jgi:hypothetical protein